MNDPGLMTWQPAQGQAQQLMLLLHGAGEQAASMLPLAQRLQGEFAQAVLLAPDGFEACERPKAGQSRPSPVGIEQSGKATFAQDGGAGRQWFSMRGLTDDNRAQRVAEVLPRLADWVRAAQAWSGVGPAATALVGFSQGAILALELVALHDGIAGRVLAFAGRYAQLPAQAPQHTTLHLFHGADDSVIPVSQARAAIGHLAALKGDATIDIAAGIGHELAPTLVSSALHRLRSHIPHRTWAAALGAVPELARRSPA